MERFEKLKEYLELMDIDYVVDTSLVRGLDYYNHTVFEIKADIPDFGSQAVIGAGGRYNGLVRELDGPDTPAVGFAMGLDRTILAMESLGINFNVKDNIDIFIMYGNGEEKETASYLLQDLRMNGFISETDYMGKSFKNQFKSADRFNAHFSMIIGEEEVEKEVVNMKCNHSREQHVVALEDIVEFIENHYAGGHHHE